MKNVLSHLFYGNLNESERRHEHVKDTEEYKKYYEYIDKLSATFSQEQLKLFNEYFVLESAYEGLIQETIYTNGVRLGMCLILELIDFKPESH